MKPILPAAFALALLALPAHAEPAPAVEQCSVLHDVDGKPVLDALPSLRVIEATAGDQAFVLPADAPAGVTSIACERASLVPATNDYKVLQAGYPLAIKAPDGRVLWLEMVDGQLALSFKNGEITDEEAESLQAFLNAAQSRLQAPSVEPASSEPPPSPPTSAESDGE